MTSTIEVFPFRYRDARTGPWVKARYKAERTEIAARYAEWEITGPGEVRRPIGGYFNPGRRIGELRPLAHAENALGSGPISARAQPRACVDPDRPARNGSSRL